ncbi:hypothetical protein COLO4_31479 [Corchorus olitorius]|uniref:Neprosin PEP catalytic domain-containing protein n=1 Tax=Corchorus olitorius TaxID=93759 RepID=A0A1R3H4A8_9ROSI|nr:hypothetical protein COLO4_31479 [Corchorus olitorius]
MALKLLTTLLVILVLVYSAFTSSISMISVSSLSAEEDLELERQLKVLNKPPIKTFQTNAGDIIDCIDINKQPALDHPLLKNHKIQTKPTTIPKGLQKISSTRNAKLLPQRVTCPTGTVPIRRTSKEDLIRMKSLPKGPLVDSRQHSNVFPPNHHVVQKGMKEGPNYYGVFGYVSAYNLSVPYEQFSSANVWIQNGPTDQSDQLNVILAGWADNKTQCYNTRCPGFVSINPEIGPDYALSPVSTYGGDQYVCMLIVYQDPKTGNWWFGMGDWETVIGYWPKELLPKLSNGANHVAWGGIAIADKQGNSPPMGSGHMPNDDDTRSSYFKSIKFLNEAGGQFLTPNDDDITYSADESGCYGSEDVLFILGINIFVSDNVLEMEGFSLTEVLEEDSGAAFSIIVLCLKLSFGNRLFKVDFPLDEEDPQALASDGLGITTKFTFLGLVDL